MTSATDEPYNSAFHSEETAERAFNEARWYAVQVASGCEKRVKTNLEQRIQTFDVSDKIVQVEIPHTPAVKIRKDGSRQHTDEKVCNEESHDHNVHEEVNALANPRSAERYRLHANAGSIHSNFHNIAPPS